jgi:hypothetical protein
VQSSEVNFLAAGLDEIEPFRASISAQIDRYPGRSLGVATVFVDKTRPPRTLNQHMVIKLCLRDSDLGSAPALCGESVDNAHSVSVGGLTRTVSAPWIYY